MGLDGIPAETWFAIAGWGKKSDSLTSWERQFAYSLGIRIRANKLITEAQMPFARAILREAQEKGFSGEPTK